MKKITTTFFLLLALVLLLPTESKAWSGFVFRSSIDKNWTAETDTRSQKLDTYGNQWKREIDASNVDDDIYFRIYISDDGGKQIFPSTNGQELSIAGPISGLTNGSKDESNKSFKIPHSKYRCSKYILYADFNNGSWTLTLSVVNKLCYRIKDTRNYSCADISSGKTDINLYDDKTYEFLIFDENGTKNGYGNSGTMTGDCKWTFYQSTSACKIQTSVQGSNPYSYSRVYTFQTDWTDGDMKVSVTYQPISEYYLIVPDANVGNTPRAISGGWVPEGHKAFKMVGGRERNKKIVNPGLATVTLKIDGNKGRQLRYDSKDQIKFIIYDKTKNKYYQPDNTDYQNAEAEKNTASGDNKRFEYVDGTNVELTPRYRTSNGRDAIGRSHDDIKDGVRNTRYYYIKKGSAKYNLDGVDYPTMSLTFMFTQYNAEKNYYNKDGSLDGHYQHGNCIYYVDENKNRVRGNAKLLVAFLKTRAYNPGMNTCAKYYTEHITKPGSNTSAGVYLVGDMGGDGYLSGANTTDPNGKVNEEKYYDKNKYRMTPNYWYNGVIDNSRTDIAKADSIVYSCEIKKGTATWDNFFLSFTTGDVLGTSDMWKPLLRPRVQNKMDAQALEGGVFYYLSENKGDDADQAQALNPLLTEDQKKRYVSYKVYFNATYSTYRIEFFDGFYIAGTAVHGQTGANSSYLESANRIPMQEQTINGIKHYEHTGTFTQGGEFAFFVNNVTFANNYSEDEDADAVNITYNKKWQTQAPVDVNDKATGKDYPYYNHVKYNRNGVDNTKSLGEGNNTIKWTLPTGEYTLRFYYGGIEGLKDATNHPKALYTIDKVVTLYNVTSNFADSDHNYGGWYPFSDDCAHWLPTGIKAYYVSNIKDNKAVLTEVDNNTIPANFGVLLYNGNMNEKGSSALIHLYPVATDEADKDYTTESTKNNLLVNCAKHDPTTKIQPITGEDANKKYNYFFTPDYYIDGTLTSVPLNFWKTKTDATVVKNGTYLSVSTQVLPVAFSSTDCNYQYESNPISVAMNARNYCFPLSFNGFDDPIITGIVSIDNDKVSNNSDAWYTIQGIKTNMPSTAGIYIHNGKKVIIK